MKTLYKLHFEVRLMGTVYGLFIADDKDMQELVDSGKEIYWGEILGKHSEIMGPIEESDYTEVTKDPEVITIVEKYKLETGYNPLDYLNE